MQISFWALGWRSLWRDVRAGELRLVVLAVTLAVAALTAVGFLADRLQSGLQRDAQQLLGGDAVIASDRPLEPAYAAQAAALGLQTANTLSFPTMARAVAAQGGASKLVALKAVESGYPLRGTLRTARTVDDALATPLRDAVQTGIPQAGTVWVEAQLLDALGVVPGQPLLLGNSSLTIAAVLTQEPDKGAAFMNFAPRVMLNAADMPATGLIQPASRVNYRMAVAGAAAQAKAFEAWADAYIKGGVERHVRGVRLESLQGGRPELSQTLDRAGKFLSLVALLSALLSAVAVALAARAFAAAHLDDCAMLRVLGLPQRTIAASYVVEFAWVGVFASALGLLLGYGLHHVFLVLLAGLVETRLPSPGWAPVLLGGGMGLTLLFAFGLPPVLQLAQVPPLRVIRRDMGQLRPASVGVLAVGVAGFAALLMAVSSDVKLGLIAVGGFAAAVLVFAGLGWLAIQLLRRSVNEATAPRALVLATRQIAARPAYTVVQISALAVGLLALVLLVLLRTDLISGWRSSTPPDAPNRFVINLMPEQAQPFQQALRAAGVEKFDWYPMIRGRLVAVNGRSVSAQDYQDERARRLVEREFNLSNSAVQPPNNTITGGRWQAEEVGAISLEEGLAKTLRLKVGDVLRFEVAGAPIDSTVTSLRKVDWASMRANFFALYPVSAMPDLPVTYLSAFKAPPVRGFDNALVRQFPNITATDVGSAIAQLQKVLDQVIAAVEFLFVFTLAAGLVVLFAAVSATREDRAREYAIMRAVGAGSALLRQVQRIELAGVGLLAGFLASLVASAVGWALAHYVFDFAWVVSLWVPLAGSLAGAALALAAGWWGLREVLNRPVMQTLRQAAT
jgi:putative ABC transport system permease protein